MKKYVFPCVMLALILLQACAVYTPYGPSVSVGYSYPAYTYPNYYRPGWYQPGWGGGRGWHGGYGGGWGGGRGWHGGHHGWGGFHGHH